MTPMDEVVQDLLRDTFPCEKFAKTVVPMKETKATAFPVGKVSVLGAPQEESDVSNVNPKYLLSQETQDLFRDSLIESIQPPSPMLQNLLETVKNSTPAHCHCPPEIIGPLAILGDQNGTALEVQGGKIRITDGEFAAAILTEVLATASDDVEFLKFKAHVTDKLLDDLDRLDGGYEIL